MVKEDYKRRSDVGITINNFLVAALTTCMIIIGFLAQETLKDIKDDVRDIREMVHKDNKELGLVKERLRNHIKDDLRHRRMKE